MGQPRGQAQKFPETNWAMVRAARDGDPPQKKKALEEICSLYWYPFYTYARMKGNSPEDAEDLTQGFFAMLLKRDILSQSDPKKGRLRSFLLTAMKNYIRGEWREANRLKRGGGIVNFSLDAAKAEKRYLEFKPTSELSPDKVFDRQWVTALMEHVMDQLRKRCEAEGKGKAFEILKAHITPDAQPLSPSEAAELLETSENAAKVVAYRLRRRYARMLREAVGETLGEKEDVESELSYLMGMFA